MFVAATWDMQAGVFTVYWRDGYSDAPVGNLRMETGPAIWVGALNDDLDFAARNMVVDELRIIGRSLSRDQITALQSRSGTGGSTLQSAPLTAAVSGPATDTPTATGMETPYAACAAPGDCAAGSYCAVDHTCHPDRHRPLRDAGLTTTVPTLPIPVTGIGVAGSVSSESAYLVCDVPADCGTEGEQCLDVYLPAAGTEGSLCTHTCRINAECGSANGFSGMCYSVPGKHR